MDDQTDIKFLKQQEFNANIVKRLEELEDLSGQFDISGRLLRNDNQILRKEFEEFKKSTLIRLDQGVENRTKAFERIEVLEKQVSILKKLLDRYFTLEINNIKDSHGKRKV